MPKVQNVKKPCYLTLNVILEGVVLKAIEIYFV